MHLLAAVDAASKTFSKHLALGVLLILAAVALVLLRLYEARQAAAARRQPSVMGSLAPPPANTGRAWAQLGGAAVLLLLGVLFIARVI